jgi:hypothetical protein
MERTKGNVDSGADLIQPPPFATWNVVFSASLSVQPPHLLGHPEPDRLGPALPFDLLAQHAQGLGRGDGARLDRLRLTLGLRDFKI